MEERQVQQRHHRYLDSRVQLDLQLRSTTIASMSEDEVRYDVDVQTYDYLRDASLIRALLVVLVLPEDEATWLSQSVEELIQRRCAYWDSLRGTGAVAATSSIRVRLPRTQVFSVKAVGEMLNRLSQGGEA
jgi:hypothetical protein